MQLKIDTREDTKQQNSFFTSFIFLFPIAFPCHHVKRVFSFPTLQVKGMMISYKL